MAEKNTLETLSGKLNQEVEKNTYEGGTTETATVVVDNNTNTIYVNAKINAREIKEELAKVEAEYKIVEDQYAEVKTEYGKVQDEYIKVKQTEGELINKVTSLDKTLGKEIERAKAAEGQLATDLATEVTRATTAEQTLQTNINTEARERKAEDEKLTQNINKVAADLVTETEARKTADTNLETTLTQKISDTKELLETEIASETSRAQQAEAELQTAINTEKDRAVAKETELKADIEDEVSARESADDALRVRIDGIDVIIDQKLQPLEGRMDTAEANITQLRTDVDNIGEVIEEKLIPVEQQITTINGQIQNLGDRIDTADADIDRLKSQMSDKATISYVDSSVGIVASQLADKGSSMYYDTAGEFDPAGKSFWYMVNVKTRDTGIIPTIDNVIGGPYEFGTGGGGGGSISKVTIEAIGWPKACQYGGTCNIVINWKSVKDEKVTGNGSIAIYVNDVLKATYRNRPQGTLTFDVGEYLENTTNYVEVRAVDAYGTMDKVINEITAISIKLESTFDGKIPYTGTVNYTYVPTGALTKYVKFTVDGALVATDVVKTSGDQQTHQFTGWTHGHHKLEVEFTCTIEGQQITSNKLVYDLIYYVEGTLTPIIATTFNDLEQEQYNAFNIPYIAYTPEKAESEVTLKVYNESGTEFEQTLFVGQEEQLWEYRSDKAGIYNFRIQTGTIYREFIINIKESEIKIEPVKENLALALGVVGRSNTEPHPEIWEDTEHGVSCTLSNFNFTSDGWVKDSEGNTILRITGDARVDIPFKPFLTDCKSVGKTIEIEFATREVRNYSANIISCMADNRGIYVTPQLAILVSQQSMLQTPYKEDDHIRLAFVIEKNVETRLILMYVNGIMSGAVRYPENDNFRQLNPVGISLGTNEATLDIYSIRIYDNNLTRKQIVNNWIAETQSGALKTQRYLHNDNYNDSGQIVISKLPKDLPYMVAKIAQLPTFKGDKRTADSIAFTDLVLPDQTFTSSKAQMNVQGTSSQYYFRKNFKISYKGGFQQGATLKTKYPIRPGAIEEKEFTYKADVASSEGANNVELVRYYQDSKNWKTPAEKLDSRCRVGIDGFPMVFFHDNGVDDTYFYGKMNFNNDKGNKDTYGFSTNYSEEGVYVDGDESWEITNNNTPQVLFHSDDLSDWKASFESRFPDDNTPDGHTFGDNPGELAKLQTMLSWVVSTYRKEDDSEVVKAAKLQKFRDELTNYFDLQSTLFYYLFTELFLLVDSRAKNCFPTYMKSRVAGDGGNKWFWFPYDMDTAIGINNEGSLVFGYNLEDTDTVDGALVYNGQRSAMWCNVRDAFGPELEALYKSLRSGSASQLAWTYQIIEDRFEQHQNKWSETIFNEDAYSKYILPLIQEKDDQYLSMLQGSKAEQRKWWLFNRFNYIDSKYQTGNALASTIMLRAYAKSNFHIVTYSDLYLTGNFDDQIVHFRADRDQGYTMLSPASWDPKGTDAVVSLYSANQLKEIGDLSGFMVGKANFSAATKLQKIIVGSDAEGYINEKLTELGVGNNNMLQVVNAKNCINLAQAIDLRGCANIEEVYFDNTQITGCLLPNGGLVKKLHLPNTLTNLTLRNQKSLNELVIAGTENVQSLWLENIPNEVIDPRAFITAMADGSAVRVVGFRQTFNAGADIRTFYNKLDKMRGIDAQGREVEKAQMNGIIDIDSITYADYEELRLRYTDITINAKHIRCLVRFYNEGELYNSQYVDKGEAAILPEPPTKPSTQQYYYTFKEWDKPLDNIQANTDTNAVYEQHLQVYEVKFNTQTEAVVVPSQFIEYGSKATKPADPVVPGSRFDGWFLEPETITPYDFDTPITDTITLYAKWTDIEKPSVSIEVNTYNKFTYTLKDNIAIVGYAILREPGEPTEWTSVTPTQEYKGTQVIVESGDYYVWALDRSGKSSSAQVKAYAISKTVSAGAYLSIKENDIEISTYALQTTKLNLSYGCDSHYENLKFKINGEESTATEVTVTKDYAFEVTCTPHVYTVEFNMMGKGEQVPPQSVEYNQLAQEPPGQYVEQQIIEAWYKEPELETIWHFDTDKVVANMTLYAKWVDYQIPTEVDVVIETVPTDVTFHIGKVSGTTIRMDWGDGAIEIKEDYEITHTYTATGNFTIKISCPEGKSYTLEAGNLDGVFTPDILTVRAIRCSYAVSDVTARYCVNLSSLEFSPYISSFSRYAFHYCKALKEVVLPENLEYLNEFAFESSGIVELHIPDSVTRIASQALYRMGDLKKLYFGKNWNGGASYQAWTCAGCPELEEVYFPEDAVTSLLPQLMFQDDIKLKTVVLPNNLKSISSGVFTKCTGLETITLPPNLKTLASNVFAECTSLQTIDIPESVESIGQTCFGACRKLNKVYLRNPNLKFSGTTPFNACYSIKSVGPLGSGANIEFAWEEEIPDNAFACGYTQQSINLVTLPPKLKKIGDNAFANQMIPSITFPATLQSIGTTAFTRNPFQSIIIPNSVTNIGSAAFSYCGSLVSVYLKAGGSTFKCETASQAWFSGTLPGTEIHALNTFDESSARAAFGDCWNMYNSETYLNTTFDIEP